MRISDWSSDVCSSDLLGCGPERLSRQQKQLLDEAAAFGIRCGFTIPIHDNRGVIAAVTFAVDERRPAFRRNVEARAEVLQPMALFFHAPARRNLSGQPDIRRRPYRRCMFQ